MCLGVGSLMHSAVPGEEARDDATEQVCTCQQRRSVESGPEEPSLSAFPTSACAEGRVR